MVSKSQVVTELLLKSDAIKIKPYILIKHYCVGSIFIASDVKLRLHSTLFIKLCLRLGLNVFNGCAEANGYPCIVGYFYYIKWTCNK